MLGNLHGILFGSVGSFLVGLAFMGFFPFAPGERQGERRGGLQFIIWSWSMENVKGGNESKKRGKRLVGKV